MNCPRCGKPIGGYVQSGSKESVRVSNGCCPHCGCSMPSGYKVGFARSTTSSQPRKKYDFEDVKRSGKNHPGKTFVCCFAALVCCLFMILDGYITIGIIFGLLGLIVGACYYTLHYFMIFSIDGKTDTAPHGNGVATTMLFLYPAISIISSISVEALGFRWGWYLGLYGLNILLAIGVFNPPDEPKNKLDTDAVIKLYAEIFREIRNDEVKCAECHGSIRHDFHLWNQETKCAVICDKCIPFKQIGEVTEINGMRFYAMNLDAEQYFK